MSSCTFFGHRDCPDTLRPDIENAVRELIEHRGVTLFYVGHQGRFDALVRSVLREMKAAYPQIEYAVVLSYLPEKGRGTDAADTLFPEGIETVPKRFAISWRNRWMLQRADFVVSYLRHDWGGAAAWAEKAKRQGKTVVEICGLSRERVP